MHLLCITHGLKVSPEPIILGPEQRISCLFSLDMTLHLSDININLPNCFIFLIQLHLLLIEAHFHFPDSVLEHLVLLLAVEDGLVCPLEIHVHSLKTDVFRLLGVEAHVGRL